MRLSLMKSRTTTAFLMIFTIACMALLPAWAQDKKPATTVPVRMTVTLKLIGENKRMPEVTLRRCNRQAGRGSPEGNGLDASSW